MKKVQAKAGVLLATTSVIEGHPVTAYHGMVTGRAVFAANFMRDFFARITDTLGGRSRSYEAMIEASVEAALLQMALTAREQGANAVIGIDVDISDINGKMMVAACYGTAVRLHQS